MIGEGYSVATTDRTLILNDLLSGKLTPIATHVDEGTIPVAVMIVTPQGC